LGRIGPINVGDDGDVILTLRKGGRLDWGDGGFGAEVVWMDFEALVPAILDQVLFVFVELAIFIELREFRGEAASRRFFRLTISRVSLAKTFRNREYFNGSS
jgi:hypothetical protein